jgi:hypothetical protein
VAHFQQLEGISASDRRKPPISQQRPKDTMKLQPFLKVAARRLLRHRRKPPRLAFMHIPKTAGQSITDSLSRSLHARCNAPVFDRSLFGAFTGFDTIAPQIKEQIHLRGRCPINGGNFIVGHLAFSTLRAFCPAANFMTVLREPRSRVLSHWIYWRTLSDEHLALWGAWAAHTRRSHLPLAAFLGCPDIACQTDNLIVRMLLWPHLLIPVDDFIPEDNDQALVAAASSALTRFAFVDTIENSHFHVNLQAWLGSRLEHTEINKTPPVPPDLQSPIEKELGCDALNLLERRTRLDFQLWSAVVERLTIADDTALFARGILDRNIARFSRLMSGCDSNL